MKNRAKKSIDPGAFLLIAAVCLSSLVSSQAHATAATPVAPSEAADAVSAEKKMNINGGEAVQPAPAPEASPVADPLPAEAAATPPSSPPTSADADFPPQPVSVSPPDVPVPPPAQADLSGASAGGNILGDTGAKTSNSGGYYDANDARSSSKSRGKQAPRRLDPAVTPGGKFVAVETSAAANSYEAQYVAASRALKLGRYAAAMEMFEGLYKKNRKDPRILMGLAVAQQGAGFNQSAAATYEDLLRIDPSNSDAIVNLMGILKAQYPDVTLKRLMELRSKYPTNPGIPAQIGLVNAELKKYPDAIKFLEIASSMDPRNASHIYNLAIVTDRSGDWVKAIHYYERALELDASYGDTAGGLNREAVYDRLAILRRKS